jgi:hypothetical protein
MLSLSAFQARAQVARSAKMSKLRAAPLPAAASSPEAALYIKAAATESTEQASSTAGQLLRVVDVSVSKPRVATVPAEQPASAAAGPDIIASEQDSLTDSLASYIRSTMAALPGKPSDGRKKQLSSPLLFFFYSPPYHIHTFFTSSLYFFLLIFILIPLLFFFSC